MSAESESGVFLQWLASVAPVSILMGWLHLKQTKADAIAAKISEKLTDNYMTRADVEKKVDGALDEFRRDISGLKKDVKEQLKDVSDDVKYLVRLKIEENKRND